MLQRSRNDVEVDRRKYMKTRVMCLSFNIINLIRNYTLCCFTILLYLCCSPVRKVPQHAPFSQEAPPLRRSRFDRDRFFAADTHPRPDIPDRLRDPFVPVWRVAYVRPMRSSPRRIHPADYALAGGTAAANMALSHERLL